MTNEALRLRNIYFDGFTYVANLDRERLRTQLERVFAVMKNGDWLTLRALAETCGGNETSVSARIRDLRKDRFGAHEVERKRDSINPAIWWYRLRPAWQEPRQEALL